MSECLFWSDGQHLFQTKRGPLGPHLPHPSQRRRKPIASKVCACGEVVTRKPLRRNEEAAPATPTEKP